MKRVRLSRGHGGTIVAAVAFGVIVFVVVSLLQTRRHGSQGRTTSSYAVLDLASPHVAGGYETYSVKPGSEGPAQPSQHAVLKPAAFVAAIAQYRQYAEAELSTLAGEIAKLRDALASGNRRQSEASWRVAYTRYLRLGTVYTSGAIAKLNEAIDGSAGGVSGGPQSPDFAGLHRIEYGLWTGASPQSLLGITDRLARAVIRLRALVPHAEVGPTEYANRAHEVLEDALRDLLSGTDVPWSEQGVAGTAAGLAATEELLATLHPLLYDEEAGRPPPVGRIVQQELVSLRATFDVIAREHGGRLPSNSELSQGQNERLQGALGGALEALSEVPVELEAEPPLRPQRIPVKDATSEP